MVSRKWELSVSPPAPLRIISWHDTHAVLKRRTAMQANRRLHPSKRTSLRRRCGAQRPDGFDPIRGRQKRRLTFVDRLKMLWVGRQGVSLLRRRPLRRFAPCALRWQMLAHFLSSAPLRVRPHVLLTKKRPTEVDRLNNLWWAVRGSACFAGGRFGALRLARCAGKCLRISSASRPDGFDPMRGQQKSDQPKPVALTYFGWAVRGSNPGPWD